MSVKILHTSDWHLGKKLFREERKKEHEFFLAWLIETIKTEGIDLLIIAGDIFDVSNPPHQTLEFFNETLHQISKLGTKIFVLGGNHDSGTLLEAPSSFYKEHSITVSARLKENFKEHFHHYDIKGEKFILQSLPYFRNHEIYNWLEKETKEEERENLILKALDKFLNAGLELSVPKILVSHHLYGSFIESGSEQSLSLSGLHSIPLSLLQDKFDYVALGHIHKPQILKKSNPAVVYSGSPIPLRFSEKETKKISIIEIKDGALTYEVKDIPTFRKLIQMRTTKEHIFHEIEKLEKGEPLPHFLEVALNLEEPISGLVDQVKEKIDERGHILLSYYPIYKNSKNGYLEEDSLNRKNINELSIPELFEIYYKEKFEITELSEESKKVFISFNSLLQRAKDEEDRENNEAP